MVPSVASMRAIMAAAAAIGDTASREAAIAHNEEWLASMSQSIGGLGLKVTPSAANFLLVHFDDTGAHTAAKADAHLMNDGIIVRRMEAYGLPHALRITIGLRAENEAVIASLKSFLARGECDV